MVVFCGHESVGIQSAGGGHATTDTGGFAGAEHLPQRPLPSQERRELDLCRSVEQERLHAVFTITDIGADSFQGRMQITDGSGNVLVDTTDAWQCTTGGLVELAGPLGATLQSAYGGATMKTLSTTGVTIPSQIKAGDTWGQVSQLEFTSAAQTYQATLTYNFSAFGNEQVSVPAGTFNAMKVQVRALTQAVLSGQTVDVTITGFEWFAPGVGHVKSSETVYAFGIPFASEEGELQSYNIP